MRTRCSPVATASEVARTAVFALLAALGAGCATAEGPSRGQQILFAPSVATMSDAHTWSVIVQGRVFEPARDSPGRQAVIDALAPFVGAVRTDPVYRERAGDLISDSVRNVQVTVSLGDEVARIEPTDPAGYFRANIALADDQAVRLARDGVITFESLPGANNPSRFRGTATLVPDGGVIVVTDIDDTIKETNVRNPADARANTLLRPFRAVTGMPEVYRKWKESAGRNVHFHVVSAGPWQLHEPLRRFTEEAGFPSFTWDMRSVDTTDPATLIAETVHADPARLYEFKVQAIRALLQRLPTSHVVLVGDSGERDPETYATILSEFPNRVDAVYVRDVSGQGREVQRYRDLFPTPAAAAKLLVFDDPDQLPQRLGAAR
jgi:phosphatidate phosphatase APP1